MIAIRLLNSKLMLQLFLISGILVYSASIALSQISLEFKTDQSQYEIGSPIECTIRLSYDPEVAFDMPDFASLLTENKEVELFRAGIWDTLQAENAIYLTHNFALMIFDTGNFELGPLALPFVYNDQADTIISNDLQLRILPVSSDSDGGMAPIKDIVRVNVTPVWVWWLLGGLIVLALLFYWYYRASRKAKVLPQDATISPEPLSTPWKTAMDDLELLKSRISEETYFYTQLSFIIRRFLSEITDINALELPSDEILDKLLSSGLGAHRVILHELLNSADLAKYAKGHSPEEYRLMVLRRGQFFVEHFANTTKRQVS